MQADSIRNAKLVSITSISGNLAMSQQTRVLNRRRPVLSHMFATLAIAAICAMMFGKSAQAGSVKTYTLDNKDSAGLVTGGSQSTFGAQSFALNVAGVGTGDTVTANSPLPAEVNLNTMTFVKAPSGTATAGNLFIKLYTGSANATGTPIAVSTNGIDVNAAGSLTDLVWNFPGTLLSTTTTYYSVFSTNGLNDSTGTDLVGARLTAANFGGGFVSTYAGGTAFNAANPPVAQATLDARFEIGFSSVPEPSTFALLGLGLVGIASRRRRGGKKFATLAIAAICAMTIGSSAQAGSVKTITLDNKDHAGLVTAGSQATFGAQSFALNVAGVGTGDTVAANSPLPADLYLNTMTFVKAPSGTATAGSLFIKLYTGSANATGTPVSVSTNGIDVNAAGSLTDLVWNFPGTLLSSTTTYFSVFSTNGLNDSTGTDLVGARLAAANFGGGFISTYAGGQAFNALNPPVGQALDARFEIGFSVVPEPSTFALLGLGLVGIASRRRRREAA